MNIQDQIDRLRPFAEEPARNAMSRGTQFPSAQGKVLSLEQELARVRLALNEALSLLDLLARSETSK